MRKTLIIPLVFVFLFSCTSPRPWTKQEKIAAGFFIAAHGLNAYSTERHQDSPEFHTESNFLLNEHPSDTKIIGYFSITAFLTLGAAHFWPDLRKPLLVSYGLVNTKLAHDDFQRIRDEKPIKITSRMESTNHRLS